MTEESRNEITRGTSRSMNAEEAKVPDVEGHWESIEIFLFSNGQQYTPPRKYHLRAEELNVWEDTLNLLAHSHYGLQSTPINLYTTDGQLVEGPLELKDGLAYVAVAPPDTFIDAGYQKYLIKASRSWEKRQARKKIPECVTEDLCCVCLVKERCCDVQKCCLCPEKDEDALESLYCATGHPELRPAGGHFMSSAPSKPGTADNYRPRSGKIASAVGEHAVRPAEFGYSPVESSVQPDVNRARLVEYGANPTEHDLRPSENGSRLGELKARPDEYGASSSEFGPKPAENVPIVSKNGVRPIENGARLNENGEKPGEFVASFNENGPRLSKDGARLREYGTKSYENAAIPDEYETRPTINGVKPSVNAARPGKYEAKPSEQGTRPREYETRPTVNEAQPDEYKTRLVENETRSSVNGDKPSEYVARPGKHETEPTINGLKLSDYKAQLGKNVTSLSVNGAVPGEYKARPVENETRSSVNGYKPNEYGAKPAEYETKPGVNEAKPSEYVARPGEYETGLTTINGAKPSEVRPDENKPSEYKTKLRENEIRPIVNDVKSGDDGTRPSIHGAKLGEYEAKPTVNGARHSVSEGTQSLNIPKPDQNGARPGENETRRSVNVAKPSEYGTRPSEYESRPRENGAELNDYEVRPGEYETGPTVTGAKPNEYKTSPGENGDKPRVFKVIQSINGAKPSEYKARPGENGTKLSEYKARPGENGAKLSEYKARPGENGTKLSEYKARPGENGAKPSEYKARPSENGSIPSAYKTKPIDNEIRPSVDGAKPGDYGAKPGSEYKTKPIVNGVRNSINEGTQSLNIAKPFEYGARPGEDETKPGVNGVRSDDHSARPSVNKTGPSVHGAKPSEYGARTGEYESGPKDNRAKPDRYETKPTIKETKPGEFKATSGEFASAEQKTQPDEYRPAKGGARSEEDGVRPGNDRPWSNEIESKKEAYGIELHDNERSLDDNIDRLDKDTVDKDAGDKFKFRKQSSTLSPIGESELEKKGENGVAESDQEDKQIDPNDRASGNEGSGSARRVSGGEQSGRENDTVNGISEPKAIAIDNARRPTELRPSGNESKRRSSQQRGEIEHTRRLSRQAGAEIEQGSRTAELTREFEYGDKVSEPKDRETNPAGRAGLTAARLPDQRNKQNDHLARLGGRESRVGDHEARAGDLRLRTSNHDGGLVHPGSTVADTGARGALSASRASPRDRMNSIARTSSSGQPKTAAKLGYPGARQSNAGGTGAAGASHISEAQQHARRTSLSTGRALTEKKRLSTGQNSSLLRTPISSALRKSEDKQPIKTKKEFFLKKITAKASAIPDLFSNADGQSKPLRKDSFKSITPPALPPPTSITNLVNLAINKAENIIDEKEMIVVSTHLFKEPESETRSMRFDSVKQVVDVIKNSPEGTQTELTYVEKNMASVTVNEGVQTKTESLEQHRQEVSANNKAKVNSCTCACSLCCKPNHRLATRDPDENIISIQNKGDVINLKLNIEVRKIVRPVHSCQKNGLTSRSLTNVPRSEKRSEISIEDGMIMRPKSSLQLSQEHYGGQGFEGSPKVIVVQCAGGGNLNYPAPCDQPPDYDNNKKYLVLLANSVNEDMDECCNYNPPCRQCDLRQSQLKKTSIIPIKQNLSEMAFDTFTTVMVSAMPVQNLEMVKKTDMACQTEEPQGECMMTKRTVSILEDSGTRCAFQKENSSSISVTTQVDDVKTKHSCRKLCPQKCEHENPQMCSEFCPPVESCQKVQSICSQVSSEGSPQIQSTGCQKTSLQVQPHGCKPVSPTSSPFCPKPLTYIQVQTQVFSQVPQVSDAQTQTQWNSVVLQARIHPDGRYSFHLPPLNVLNSYTF